jgi:streptogramin lyase
MRLLPLAFLVAIAAPLQSQRDVALIARPPGAPRAATLESFTSADWLGLLPEGEAKRRFVLDCTGCHQFDDRITLVEGKPRTAAQWEAGIQKMLGFAGANTGFPIIAADRDARTTAHWLAEHVTRIPARRPAAPSDLAPAQAVREFPLSSPEDLPHDVAVDAEGNVIVTGMMTHQMWVLDPATGNVRGVTPPISQSNPRAVELDAAGNWWMVFGNPQRLARYTPLTGEWETFPVGMYPHSLAVGRDGDVWFNGHFTRKPELIGRVTRAGKVETFEVPAHPVLAARPGGPIPYELRAAADGTVWGSELQGNRVFSFNPSSREFTTFAMPAPSSGPRRLDLDPDGNVWIPLYTTNEIVRLDPATGTFTHYPLPVPDAVPYVVRVDRVTRDVWVGTSAADAVLRLSHKTGRFMVYPLPSRGALVRHLAIDPRTHDLWAAYGAWPGRLPAMVARVKP